MRFIKMHGLGNDYVYVNGYEHTIADPADLAPRIADRHFGVGGDGLILALPPEPGVEADVRMRMFNADGSEAEMCGNGVRCVCKLAHDYGITAANPMRVQTGNGVLSLEYTTNADGKVDQVTVDMGAPILEPAHVPVAPDKLTPTDQPQTFRLSIAQSNELLTTTFVSMGNPHAMIYVPDVHAIDLTRLGPLLERHPAFPNRMNIHFVQLHARNEVTMRTWERGSGITLACGTGASAVCVAGVLTDRNDRTITAHLPGGDLTLEWRESNNHVYMTGPATEVFIGDWPD
ncbi:diaminopimelate epimerase [Phycisphaerales bacterium AB-hyl4]|uniref:Diaminopimelate epimerase n=1 Tax=Natronomicrosphaera hydrolytica TaxID=3242702 RepID=A0ABV4U4N8_9BACT